MVRTCILFHCILASLSLIAGLLSSAALVAEDSAAVRFGYDVRPVLSDKCFRCHGPDQSTRATELRLDDEQSAKQNRGDETAIVAFQPDQSDLIRRITSIDPAVRMPPPDSGLSLSAAEVTTLTDWVSQGAHWAGHWAFEPLPDVSSASSAHDVIDQLVEKRRQAAGLQAAPPADRRTLLRRLAFDVTGLPPSADEIDAFISDAAPDAWSRRIDERLASPAYGERWGRVWLDMARYTDVTASWLNNTQNAWRYRDWVIQAFNQDRPYDEFVRLQLAADEMADVAIEDLPALGYMGLSPTYWKELRLAPELIRVIVADEWDERIDTVSRSLLGLTVSCARCHEHKFDPVSMDDYYALAGIFASTQQTNRLLLPKDEAAVVNAARKQVAALETKLKGLKAETTEHQQISQRIADIKASTPHYNAASAHVVEFSSVYVMQDGPDATKIEYREGEARELPLFPRGNPTIEGKPIQRRFLTALSPDESVPLNHQSGRLDLANAIFQKSAPLAARVIVNRVWAQHFGKGLSRTPSDFGAQGNPPSHPELLDYLAAQLIAHNWSLKWLHREILLSKTWQQGSSVEAAASQMASEKDPENRLLWRQNPRRLDIEMWRDAMLAASRRLDRTVGGPPFQLTDNQQVRRTLYGVVDRHDLNGMLRTFDFPEPSAHSPERLPTITPLQQLFSLNAEFVSVQAATIAEQLAGISADEERVTECYRRCFGRRPSDAERNLGIRFLAVDDPSQRQERLQDYAHSLLGLNEFLFVD
ncbi:MAG: PSD1 domain-containing protein [Planctomycetaceae bacterium]|nr:PSD1 domain-containing protein [Planctomycetaceae bacterium]